MLAASLLFASIAVVSALLAVREGYWAMVACYAALAVATALFAAGLLKPRRL